MLPESVARHPCVAVWFVIDKVFSKIPRNRDAAGLFLNIYIYLPTYEVERPFTFFCKSMKGVINEFLFILFNVYGIR